jgi:serine kinase of HPr protein (carbohydrate metabolism regulator)
VSADILTIHASCVGIGGRAVLISGRSGSGKSDLTLRLLDRGAVLVSDDYTEVRQIEGVLTARPPERIAGKLEVRGVGIVEFPFAADLPVALLVEVDRPPERLPERAVSQIAGVEIPIAPLAALEASAPLKVEFALLRFGLPIP